MSVKSSYDLNTGNPSSVLRGLSTGVNSAVVRFCFRRFSPGRSTRILSSVLDALVTASATLARFFAFAAPNNASTSNPSSVLDASVAVPAPPEA